MSKYFALLTQLGADRLANAAALGTKIEITHMAVGDGGGSLPTPDTNQQKLVSEKRRAAINVLSIDPKNTNQIIAEQVIPESEGGWWIREIGLFDKDGVLIAVGNCAETYKPQLQEGSGRTQTIRMVLIVSHTNAVTLKIDPSVVLATREYADASIAQAIREHEQSRRHPEATLTEKGFVVLSNAVDSQSETQAATPKAVKAAYALASTASQQADNANNNANRRLEKARNGADVLNKAQFVSNIGAYPKTGGTIEGKVFTTSDVDVAGWIGGTTLFDRHQNGTWSQVYSEAHPPKPEEIGAFPASGGIITGEVYANGDVYAKEAVRVTKWVGAKNIYVGQEGNWHEVYSPLKKPTAAEVGAYSMKETRDRFALKVSQDSLTCGDLTCGNLHVEATHDWAGVVLKKPSGYNTALASNPDDSSNMLTLRYRDKRDSTLNQIDFPKKNGTVALESQLVGVGQRWTDVTSSRNNGSWYTNSTNKPIIVYVESAQTNKNKGPFSMGGEVDGQRVGYFWASTNVIHSFSFIVPPDSRYMVSAGWDTELGSVKTGAIAVWRELK